MTNIYKISPSSSCSPQIIEMLNKGDWQSISLALQSGLRSTISMDDDFSLFYTILEAFNFHNPSKESLRTPLPDFLKDALLNSGIEKDTIFENGQTPIVIAIEYGQWSLAKELVDKGFVFDTDEYPALDSLLTGYINTAFNEIESSKEEDLEGDQDQELDSDYEYVDDDIIEVQLNSLNEVFPEIVVCKEEMENLKVFMPLFKEHATDWPISAEDLEKNLSNNTISHRSNILNILIIAKYNFLIEQLLENGAPLDFGLMVQDKDGNFYIAKDKSQDMCIRANNHEALEILFSQGSNWIPAIKDQRPSMFTLAIEQKAYECLPVLLDFCPDNLLQAEIDEALHFASAAGDIRGFDMLVSFGANIHHKTNTGYSILHQCANMGQKDMIEKVLDLGFSWDERADNSISPKDLLIKNHKDLASYFKFNNDNVKNNVVLFPARKMRR